MPRPIIFSRASFRAIASTLVEERYPGIRHALSSVTGAFVVGLVLGASPSMEQAHETLKALESLLVLGRDTFGQSRAATCTIEFLVAQGFITIEEREQVQRFMSQQAVAEAMKGRCST